MSFVDSLIYLKLCVNRAYTHFSVPISIVNLVLLLSVWFKLNDMSMWTSVAFGIIVLIFFGVVGHYDLKMGIFKREQSLQNLHNPEIMRLLEKKQ